MKKYLSIYLLSALIVLLAACGTLSGDTLTLHTADPNLSVVFQLQPAPVATEEPILPTVTPTPAGCVNAKGNISASGEKIYHCPGQANYNNVKIDKEGEAIFETEQEAIDAGFRKSLR